MVYLSVKQWQTYGVAIILEIPLLCIGLAGIWRGRSFWVLVPAVLAWLALAGITVFLGSPQYFLAATFVASLTVGVWVGLSRRRTELLAIKQFAASMNRLGWDLYHLSTEPPVTDESLSPITVHAGLDVGEVERHFDQVTSAAIRGGMQHMFKMHGTTAAVQNLPFFVNFSDTQSWMTLGGSGRSSVDLSLSGTASTDLTSDAFVAVFERRGSGVVDTIRAVVPSERQARTYVEQVLSAWGRQLGPNTESELMVRRYSGAIASAVSSDSSYVGDRLRAILRMPVSDRPSVTLIGEPLNEHAVLAGAVRFGSNGPLYQLFPIALVRALLALIDGRHLPKPPAGLPPSTPLPAEQSADAEPSEFISPNGHAADLSLRTLGGLRVLSGSEDLTSALVDRKVLAFIWLHLLARKLRNPNDTITRASLADELSPGLESSTQRSRLRGRLSEVRNELPPAVGRRVTVSGDRITLDLTGCHSDFHELLDAEKTYRGSNGLLAPDQLAALESVLAGADGQFLPDWDDLEHHVNGARGGAGEVVAELRSKVDLARAGLLLTLGTAYLAHGKPEPAVGILERGLHFAPDDEAIAKSLVTACLQSGRLTRADELKKEFSLV